MGATLTFARTPEELEAELKSASPALVIVDLTTSGWDYGLFFDKLVTRGLLVESR